MPPMQRVAGLVIDAEPPAASPAGTMRTVMSSPGVGRPPEVKFGPPVFQPGIAE